MALEEKDMLLIAEIYNFEVNFFNFEKKHRNHNDFSKIRNCRNSLYHFDKNNIKLGLLTKIFDNIIQPKYLEVAYPEDSNNTKITFENILGYNKIIKDAIGDEYIGQKCDYRIYNIFEFEARLILLEDAIIGAINKHVDNKHIIDLSRNLNQIPDIATNIVIDNEHYSKHLFNLLAAGKIEDAFKSLNEKASKITQLVPMHKTLNKKNQKGAPLTLGDKFGLLKKYVIIDNQFEQLFNEINNFGSRLRHEDDFKKTATINPVLFDNINKLDATLSSI